MAATAMLQNYLKIAFRNFQRQTFFSLINVTGLAVGLAACWLIVLYVLHEKSFDTFLPYSDRVCAVALDLKMGEQEGTTTNTPPPLGLRLKEDFPEIELVARTFHLGNVMIQRNVAGNKPMVFNENTAMAADTAFLELFGIPMIEGSSFSALDNPGSIVLSQQMAAKYFGSATAIGQTLLLNNRLFKITGIMKDFPTNSSLRFDFLLPIADFRVVDNFAWSWVWLQVDTWVRLREPASDAMLAQVEKKFPAMVRKYAPAAYERVGQNFEDQLKRGDRYDIKLLPLNNLHLGYEGLISRLKTLGDGQQVKIFGIIGVLILLLACVNFMNLSTARSMRRTREVGVRKALGSHRSALIGQFLTESLLFSIIAMLMAAVLIGAVMPFYNRLTGLQQSLANLFSSSMMVFVVLLPLVAGLLGGLYPAFYLSSFKAIEMFKSSNGLARGGHAGIRSGLVVFQFTVSIALMLGAFVVFKQLEFAQNVSPGLQREHVLVIDNVRHFPTYTAREAFRQELSKLPEALNASHATFLPSMGSFGDFYEPEHGDEKHAIVQNLPIGSYLTDTHFVPTLGIEILKGRNFHANSLGDSSSVILNETAVKAIGWKNPIGKWIRYPGNANQRFQVVGVMRDFHESSVRTTIEPMALFHESSKTYQTWGSYIAVRLQAGTEKQAIAKISNLWSNVIPDSPFEYDFLDASFARLYRSEAKMGTVLGVLTGLALFIGCLGLFALAAFTAENRTKEIGIRKVLGASISSIITMLSGQFLKLVLLALVIAAPITWYLMDKWLQDFAYRIGIEWWMIVLIGGLALLIAFLTVGFQALKAAMMNPVESLKSE